MESLNKSLDGELSFKIFSEGTELGNNFGLISFLVRKEVNRIGKALLVFNAGNMSAGEIPESDDEFFSPGKKIAIHAGYNANDLNLIFEGFVITHELKIYGKNECVLHIECRDFAYQTTLIKKDEMFQNKKDNEVISEILQKYKALSASVESTQIQQKILYQSNCSDWEFILSRAQANGLYITTEGNKICIKKPELQEKAVLKITYGLDLIEFDGKLSASEQISKIKVQAWDPTTQKMKMAESESPRLNKQGDSSGSELAAALNANDQTISLAGYMDDAELQSLADSKVLRMGLARITGSCKFYGNAKAIPGKLLQIEGLGRRFNGDAFIGTVEHKFSKEGWFTTVGMGLNTENLIERTAQSTTPAVGLLPEIQGLHIGKVIQIDKDLEEEYKILVTIPSLPPSCNSIWARLANNKASSSYGSFFIPDIEDEVVLGFFNNDPRFPVIIGSLYSSKQKPPYEIEDTNKICAFVSKSQMKIEFEDEKKIITISTPANNTIILNDDTKGITMEDQNKNKIVMDSNGILIDSVKGITIKSKGDTVLDSSTNMNINAKNNVSAQGMNVELKANAALTAKGTVKAEISASGQTIVKGAMVMIN